MYAVHTPTAEETLPQLSTPLSDRITNNEAMLLSFLAEKSLPFSLAPNLIEIAKELARDKKALDRMFMHRTTAAYKLQYGVAQTFKEKLIYDLKSNFFSLNIDESTSNNNQKIVSILVNYLEEGKIVTKHLTSFSVHTVSSDSLFQGIKNVFEDFNIPWENMMSVLLDSCNVMRGKKSGLETKLRSKCPHLLDIDGDSCHHAHNSAKQFCKPFSNCLENLITDIHNDFKWSPDLRVALRLLCEILNVKYTVPQNFISCRWLSICDVTQDLSRLFDVFLLFYFSFLCPSKRCQFLHFIVKIYKQHKISEEGKDKIRFLQTTLRQKVLTEAGEERKMRIIKKLFDKQLETKLNMSLFLSVLPLLRGYVKLFQMNSPLIHLLHDKQKELLKNFLTCFIKPEVLLPVCESSKKIKQLDLKDPKNYLPKKSIFIGEMAKKLIVLAPKTDLLVIKTFYKNTIKAYVASAEALQSKMPLANKFLKAVSSIDPWCRQHSLSLKLMKELPDHVKNVIHSTEIQQFDLEVHRYHSDSFPLPKNKEGIDTWWFEVQKSLKYPLLSKIALALLTCFHGPKVESSFSMMNSIITPESNRINVSTFDSIQSIKYELSSKNTSSVAFFRKKNFLQDPIDKNLCKNMKSSCKKYKEEKLKNKMLKEVRKKEMNCKINKELSKAAAKRICTKAAKEERKKTF